STLSIPTATKLRGDFGSGVSGSEIGSRGPDGPHIVGDSSIGAGNAVVLMDHADSCSFENLTIEGAGASYAVKALRQAGLIIRNCNFSGSNTSTGGHAAYAGLQPALLLDSCFWTQLYDSRFANEDGSSPAVWNRAIETPGGDVGVGLFVAYNCCSAGSGGALKLGPANVGTGGATFIDYWLHENMHFPNSLIEIDATGNDW